MNIKKWEEELKPVTKTFSIVERDAQEIIEKFVNQYWESLKPYIAELVERVEKSNDILRITYQIAARKGQEVEWDNYIKVLEEELVKQHKIIHTPNKEKESEVCIFCRGYGFYKNGRAKKYEEMLRIHKEEHLKEAPNH